MKKVVKIISGGQTGADIAGLKAAQRLGIETGGYCPKGWRTENGANPSLGSLYGLKQTKSSQYPPRTRKNVSEADVTLIIGTMTGGTKLTVNICLELKKPYIFILEGTEEKLAADLLTEFLLNYPKDNIVMNVAGGRESKHPGIEKYTIGVITSGVGQL